MTRTHSDTSITKDRNVHVITSGWLKPLKIREIVEITSQKHCKLRNDTRASIEKYEHQEHMLLCLEVCQQNDHEGPKKDLPKKSLSRIPFLVLYNDFVCWFLKMLPPLWKVRRTSHCNQNLKSSQKNGAGIKTWGPGAYIPRDKRSMIVFWKWQMAKLNFFWLVNNKGVHGKAIKTFPKTCVFFGWARREAHGRAIKPLPKICAFFWVVEEGSTRQRYQNPPQNMRIFSASENKSAKNLSRFEKSGFSKTISFGEMIENRYTLPKGGREGAAKSLR